MNKYSFKKPVVLSSLAIFLLISISFSTINLSYAFLVLDYGGTDNSSAADTSAADTSAADTSAADTSVDRSITSSQSSYQSSYCYAPPNATIINSCNSEDFSASENTGLNIYEH